MSYRDANNPKWRNQPACRRNYSNESPKPMYSPTSCQKLVTATSFCYFSWTSRRHLTVMIVQFKKKLVLAFMTFANYSRLTLFYRRADALQNFVVCRKLYSAVCRKAQLWDHCCFLHIQQALVRMWNVTVYHHILR